MLRKVSTRCAIISRISGNARRPQWLLKGHRLSAIEEMKRVRYVWVWEIEGDEDEAAVLFSRFTLENATENLSF